MERIKIWVAIFFYIQSLTPYNRPSESRTLKVLTCVQRNLPRKCYIYTLIPTKWNKVRFKCTTQMWWDTPPPPLKIWRPVCLTIIYQLIKNKLRDTTWKTREIPVVTEKKDEGEDRSWCYRGNWATDAMSIMNLPTFADLVLYNTQNSLGLTCCMWWIMLK